MKKAPKAQDVDVPTLVDIPPQPVDELLPNPDNPRGKVRPEDVHDLAEAIRVHGVLNPLLVTEIAGGRYQVLAGDRRLAAAKVAGLAKVPCRTYVAIREDLTRAATIVENDQRERLLPFAEAKAVLGLVEAGADHASVGRVLGRSEGWVRRRAGLCTLSKKILSNEWLHAREWPIEWLEDLASVAPEVQERLAKRELLGIRSREALQEILFEATAELAKAPWDLDDATLDPKAGSCSACPKRSKIAPGLFDLVERKNGADRCLAVPCYRGKLAAHRSRILKAARKEQPKAIALHGIKRYSDAGVRMPGQALEPERYEIVGESAKGAKPGVLVDGKRAGKTVHVRILETPKARRGMPEPKKELAANKLAEGELLAYATGEVARILEALPFPGADATLVLAAAYGSSAEQYVDRVRGRGDSREARLAANPKEAAEKIWQAAREEALECVRGFRVWEKGTASWLEDAKEHAQEAELLAGFFDARAPKGAPPFDWAAILEHGRKAKKTAEIPAEKGPKRGKSKD